MTHRNNKTIKRKKSKKIKKHKNNPKEYTVYIT